MRTDFIDFPTAWELQKEIGLESPPHHPKCSAVQTDGGMLCDCGAIVLHWESIHRIPSD